MQQGWSVLVEGDRIAAAGASVAGPPGTRVIDLPGATLMPGMIEGHSHLFLHPYDETLWDDQVLHEPLALRTARAVVHAEKTLEAGFTTERDLGTEGAGFADAGLKQAIDKGIVPGPRLLVATKAIVARGAYGPKGFEPGVQIPQGAQEVSGTDEIVKAVRDQIAGGADLIKFYADFAYGNGEPDRPTLSQVELNAGIVAAQDAGRQVAVHATTPEGMRRAILAGANTIEHGYRGTAEVFRLMAKVVGNRQKGICVTIDRKDSYDEDDMKVVVAEDGRLEAIGKRIGKGVNGESIGLLAFRSGGAEAFRDAVEQDIRSPEGTTIWYLRVIHHLAERSDVWTLDIAGEEWGEVDFPEDVTRAEALVAGWDAARKAA